MSQIFSIINISKNNFVFKNALNLKLKKIDWVIVGGESGHKPRHMEPDWVLDIQEQCEKADVRFFFKQWGGRNKKEAGRLLNGRTYDDMPEIEIQRNV